jgi:U4/U6 small nuclear ribonucleoprotein PRP3
MCIADSFRIKSLAHPARKFKTEMNAKQLQMTGIILMHKDINIVVVEGGWWLYCIFDQST